MRRLFKAALLALGLLIAALAVWALVNVPPASAPVERDHLTARDIDLVRESQHLRTAVGERIWPGFREAALPVQLYNDRFGFVVGMEAPDQWDEVAVNRIDGMPYYRTARPERQAFAVLIGGRWAGSIAVKEVADAEPSTSSSRLGAWLLSPDTLRYPRSVTTRSSTATAGTSRGGRRSG